MFFLSHIQKYIQKREDMYLEFRKDINQGVQSILSFGSFQTNMYSRRTANTSLSLPSYLLLSSASSRLSACSLTHLFNIPSNVILAVFAIWLQLHAAMLVSSFAISHQQMLSNILIFSCTLSNSLKYHVIQQYSYQPSLLIPCQYNGSKHPLLQGILPQIPDSYRKKKCVKKLKHPSIWKSRI